MDSKTVFMVGACFAGLGVILGAFAAHALKSKISSEMLLIFETGARYQMYHAFALLALAGAMAKIGPVLLLKISAYLFVFGTLVFSGSLYALSLLSMRWLGAITPIGGLSLIAGWFLLALGVFLHA